ncbi:MAG: DUF4446 family protein [Eubacteriales bacterium]|nr:DUF4446 family protein [Eubacteriales bacterium]
MSSPMMEYLGIAGMDIGWLFVVIILALIAVIVLLVLQMEKLKKLQKKYDKFMKGKDAKNLEGDILALFEDNKYVKEENEKNRKDIKDILRRLDYCYQKVGLIKYDAFNQMGGKLSFCLCLLNDKNNGFLLNSVHSSEGCYVYTKEINKGESELPLGAEEQKALETAIGY